MTDYKRRPTGGSEPAGGHVRIGHAEREAAVAALQEHLDAGRLTSVEYEDRSVRAGRAQRWEDLYGLFSDLPEPRPVPGAPAGRVPPVRPVVVDVPSRHPAVDHWLGRAVAVAPVVALALVILTRSWVWFLLIPAAYMVLKPSRRARRRRRSHW
jgi:hypothetical protein